MSETRLAQTAAFSLRFRSLCVSTLSNKLLYIYFFLKEFNTGKSSAILFWFCQKRKKKLNWIAGKGLKRLKSQCFMYSGIGQRG